MIRRNGNKVYVNWKGYDNSFNSWIDKASLVQRTSKRSYKMSKYFPPYNNSSNNIKVELDLSNYATKDDVKNITHVDVNSYASKTNLAALKTEVDKFDTDNLKAVPNNLAKLSNVVKNYVVKKTGYNTKISNIETQITLVNKNALDNLADIKVLKAKPVDTSNFVTRTKFSTDTNALDDEIDKGDKKFLMLLILLKKNRI